MCIANSLRLTDKHHTGGGVPQEHARRRRRRQVSVDGPQVSAFGSSSLRNAALSKETFKTGANIGQDAAWLQMAARAAQIR